MVRRTHLTRIYIDCAAGIALYNRQSQIELSEPIFHLSESQIELLKSQIDLESCICCFVTNQRVNSSTVSLRYWTLWRLCQFG